MRPVAVPTRRYVVNSRSVENNAPCEQQCVALARDDRGNSAQIFERVDQLRLLHLQSRCRRGSGEPSPGRGRGEPSPGADVAGVSPVPVQTWQG